MAQENYSEGCFMKIPPFLEVDGFCFWKTRYETYIKSKDIDLWQVIQNGDFVFMIEDPEAKVEVKTPYELLKDDQKKQLGKNNEAKMTFYNALPRKEYERVFMCKTTNEYEKFSISSRETIDSGFTRFNAIVTSLKSLYQDYSNKNHVRKFFRALPLKWRAKLKSLALKVEVTREKTSDDSDSQGGSDEDEAKEFNLMARNFYSEEAAKMVLEIEAPKVQDKSVSVIIAGKKATLLVSVRNPRITRLLSEELEAIAKTAMNLKRMQCVSWRSTLKIFASNMIYDRMIGLLIVVALNTWSGLEDCILRTRSMMVDMSYLGAT
ncbi:hypothetical protein Tco_1244615 [Tanacetum coccineum]